MIKLNTFGDTFDIGRLDCRVTRFGEISPIWYNFKSLGHIFGGLFSIWQNVDPTEAKMF